MLALLAGVLSLVLLVLLVLLASLVLRCCRVAGWRGGDDLSPGLGAARRRLGADSAQARRKLGAAVCLPSVGSAHASAASAQPRRSLGAASAPPDLK